MKLMLVRGNPRRDGMTEYITELFVKGVREADGTVDDVRLSEHTLKPCIGCYSCWAKTPGRCILQDDGADLMARFLEAEVIACASPLYHFTVSSMMKIFLERTFPLIAPGFTTTPSGTLINKLRHPEKWNKSLIVICAGAFRGVENFSAVKQLFRMITEGMSMTDGGYLFRPESFLLPFHFSRPKTIKSVETAFVQAGMEAARTGIVSSEVQDRVALPLSSDNEDFQKYSAIYWEHALTAVAQGDTASSMYRRVTGDVRILMHEMARNIDPLATARIKAVLQFDFPDQDRHFRISIDRGTCSIWETTSDKPDLRVTCESVTWSRMFMREINPRDAVLSGAIRLEGDKMLFARLDRLFPPPAE